MSSSFSVISYFPGVDPEELALESSTDSRLCCRHDFIALFEEISLLPWGHSDGSSGGCLDQSQQPGVFQWA